MFRLRDLLLAAIIAGIFMLLASYGLVRSGPGADRLCAVTEAVLHDVSGREIYIGQCEVDPLNTHVTIKNVRVGPADAPFFTADRLSGGVDRRGFLSGRILIDNVEVVHPRIMLDLSKPRPARPLEIRPRGAACLPDLGHVEIGTAKLAGGEMDIALPHGRSVKTTGMKMLLQGDGERLVITYDADSTVYADEAGSTTADRAHLKGGFDLNAGTAKLDEVDVSGAVGSIFFQGEMASICDLRGDASTTVQADLGALHQHLLRDVTNLSGKVALDAQVKFDATAENGPTFDATAHAKIKDSTVLTFLPGSFDAEFHATPDSLELTKFELPLDTGKVTATVKVVLAPPYLVTADAKLDNLVLGELMERLGRPELPVELRLSGDAKLSGPARGPNGAAFDVRLNSLVPEFGVYDRPFRQRLESGSRRSIGLRNATLQGDFRIGQGEVTVAQAKLESAGSQLDLSGTLSFDRDEGMLLHFGSPKIKVEEFGPFGPAECGGVGQMDGSVSGPYGALVIDAGMRLKSLRVQGFDLGDVSGHTRVDLGDHTLDVSGATGIIAQSTYVADAHLTFDGPPEIEGRLSIDDAHAIDLIGVAAGRYPSLKKLTGNLDAKVTGDVEVHGLAHALAMEAQFALGDIHAYGQRFDSGALRTTMKQGDKLSITALDLVRDDAHVRAKGELTFADRRFDAHLVTRGLMIGQIDAIAAKTPNSTGGVALQLDASGTMDHPTAAGTLVISDWRMGLQPVATAQLALKLEDGSLTANGTLQSPWPKDTPQPDHDPGTPVSIPAGSMTQKVQLSLKNAEGLPFFLHDEWAVPDARMVLPPDKLGELRAGASGTLDANGSISAIDQVQARLEISRLWMKRKNTQLQTTESTTISYSDGRVFLPSLTLHGDSFQLGISGSREADGRLALSARGGLDLSVVAEQYPDFEESRGTIELNVSLGGTQTRPQWGGTAEFQEVAMRLKGLALELTDGNGTVSFGAKGAELENFAAKLNGGPVSVTGEVALDSGYSLGAFRLQMALKDIPFRWDDTTMTFAGNPEISRQSADDRMLLSGDMEVVRLRYTHDLDFEKTAVQAVALARRPPTPRVLAKAGDFMDLKMHLKLSDVRLDNNLIKALVQGDLTLTGTNRHPGLLGLVNILEARAYIRNNEFKVSSAVVNFTDPTSYTKPNFDLAATSKVHDYSVDIHATGTPQTPVVHLSSEPALSDADIVLLLTTGVTSKDFSSGSGAVGGVVLDAAYAASGIPDQMKRLLPKNDILRDPTVHPSTATNPISGNAEPVAQFDSKIFRDDLLLHGQTSLLGKTGLNKAAVEFQFRKNLSLSGQWNDDPTLTFSTGDFGGDVRYHWEAP